MDLPGSRYIDLGGPVHVADLGGDGPPVVCVHGLGGSYANWLGAGPYLRTIGHVTALDLPGFGLTPLAGRSATVEANRRLLHRYLLQLGKPVTLIGNSMGGTIVLRQAALAPETVGRLILVSPAAPWSLRQVGWDPVVSLLFFAYAIPGLASLIMAGRHRLSPERVARWILAFLTARPEAISPDLLQLHVDLAIQRQHIPGIERAFISASRSVVGSVVRRSALDRQVAAVAAPTLVLHGAEDRLVPYQASLRLASLRPDWDVQILEQVGHVAMLEDPAEFGRRVESFVGSSAVA